MEKPKTLTVTLETVTPLFLGGADPRGTPELRAPSFRGALRYWLRAALGGVIGDNNLNGLHELESMVFGSTEYASPVQVRLRGNLYSGNEKILPHKDGRQAGQRKAFKTGERVELVMHQLRSTDETVWHAACAALNLALTFGGIGLRSRRGYGTLRVVQSSNPALVPLAPNTLESWRQYVKEVAEKAVASARELASRHNVAVIGLSQGPASYPCATRSGLMRFCDVQAPSAMEITKQFMQKARKNRAFGDIQPRQASPLWVRPIQLDQHYSLLLVVLASQFNGANYGAVQAFLDKEFKGEDLRVKGWNA